MSRGTGVTNDYGLGLGVCRIHHTIQNVRNWIAYCVGPATRKKQSHRIRSILRDNQRPGVALRAKTIVGNVDLVGEGNIESAARPASLLISHVDSRLYGKDRRTGQTRRPAALRNGSADRRRNARAGTWRSVGRRVAG